MRKNLYKIFTAIIIAILFMCFYLNQRVSVSIVIPVYNAEKYLSKCLDSILSQSKKVEIIAVNDGSTDNSLNILNNYASKYSNIKVINQSNQGVSFARNTGMNASTKDYITFVDSDDWLEPDAIQTALKIIKKDNPDILLTSYYDVYNKEWIENIRNKKDAESMQDDVKYSSRSLDKLALYTPFYAKDALSDLYYIGGGVRGRFFSKKFIKQNNLTFPLYLQCYEDDVFIIKAFSYNPKISVTDKEIYNYLNRYDSISKSQNILSCGQQSWEIISSTKEYQNASRIQKMLIKDLFTSYIFLSIANFKRHNLPLDKVLDEAHILHQSYNVYNKKERQSLRNFQKLHNILYNRYLK